MSCSSWPNHGIGTDAALDYLNCRPNNLVDACHSFGDALSVPLLTTIAELMGFVNAGRSAARYSCSVLAEFRNEITLDSWLPARIIYGPSNNRQDAHAGGLQTSTEGLWRLYRPLSEALRMLIPQSRGPKNWDVFNRDGLAPLSWRASWELSALALLSSS